MQLFLIGLFMARHAQSALNNIFKEMRHEVDFMRVAIHPQGKK